ncbi:hypothetical protein [Tuwongella immobilis]|uniref:Uncharacterized protein n=1 Tax=Tuwongella immobilis TaxID=692036 RepID=A0A6C2YQM2_9BACT|nr:hypothetical protein [Tuwongella immobilis]VIP03403.1 Uncharacterized protein OS=Isosphaera pallida (strain ATCC 43644 / DSM 9630 / IS1B) GN=Isop_2897 PE=4 SV=1 [Tuwongella immobilis]VTS04178.1 Uncharacterized protein OS=Isosphaera pallida (strain ATCC 43644 / DSM 9630 / IS1B) GN=Isop_2897 PE=4 SV=1 [Tuwongella immobilis]
MSIVRCAVWILAWSWIGATAWGADPKSKLGGPTELDSFQSSPPKEWKAEKPANRLRDYQYRLPKAEGEPFDGEVTILPNVRGSVEQNMLRWREQFIPPANQTLESISKMESFQVGKAKVSQMEVNGTWVFKERPFDPKSKEEQRANYSVIWVIFETPNANFQIRMSGPAATVKRYRAGFDQWLRGFKE